MQEPPVSKGGPNRPPVRLTPMPVPKASEVLADDLRERILLGEFPEGTALPTERDLVAQTLMSRATVREALRILEVQGLIRIRTGRAGGAFVQRPDDESVADSVALVIRGRRIRMAALLETREAVEPACAQLAARYRTDADLKRLDGANDGPGFAYTERDIAPQKSSRAGSTLLPEHFARFGHGVDSGFIAGGKRDEVDRGGSGLDERCDELGDLRGSAVRDVALELPERSAVETFHGRSDPVSGLRPVSAEATPEGHAVAPLDVGPAGARAVLLDDADRFGAPVGRGPDAKPAIAEPACPPQRGLGPAADDQRHWPGRGGAKTRLVQLEELAVVGDALAGQQPSHDIQRLVHTPAPGPRVDPAGEDFAPVIAPDAQPEREPTGSELGYGEDLPRHQHGVTQNHEVDGKVHAEFIGGGGDGGGVGEPVVADTVLEHHVIADHDVIHARLVHPVEQASPVRLERGADYRGPTHPGAGHQIHAEPRGGGGACLCGVQLVHRAS